MINDSIMVTAYHVAFGNGAPRPFPWKVQRNVRDSDPGTGDIRPPLSPDDEFEVTDASQILASSGTDASGDDWAIIKVPKKNGVAPGEGCNPLFNSSWKKDKAGLSLTVKGFGLDTERFKNGTLQTHTGHSSAGGDNASHFLYQVDTEAGNSGSPVLDDAGRIVGIHTDGFSPCDNSGTLITNAGLATAIKTHAGIDIYKRTAPPEVPKIAVMQSLISGMLGDAIGTLAHHDTLIVYSRSFDSGGNCTAAGWTVKDESGTGEDPGLGIFAGMFKNETIQEDGFSQNLSCLWAFISGSISYYFCGTPPYPAQRVVPYVGLDGQYFHNEIISPLIPLYNFGAGMLFQFSVYRDLAMNNLVFYDWHVRDVSPLHTGVWKNRGVVHYGDNKDWLVHVESIGDLVNLAISTHVQLAIGVWDMCRMWCGIYGDGACHSHAPLIDNVKLMQLNTYGPQWGIRDIDQFQDNFATNGTVTGTVRADMAGDISPPGNPAVTPGDSAVVSVADPLSGLGLDPMTGRAAVYCYVSVWPQGQAGKTGSPLSEGPGGLANRFPVMGTQNIGGVPWTRILMDSVVVDSAIVEGRFCVDLNDDLFTPGDTVCFFYAARNTGNQTTYAYGPQLTLTGDDIGMAAASASEFTCLPAGGWNRGGDILYVDGMDGRGAQLAFESAFAQMGLTGKVDRFDVRGPTSVQNNSLAGRVVGIGPQLSDCYRKILWDTGDIPVTPGDGSLTPYKVDDYALLNTFLGGLNTPGGVYLGGDRVAEALSASWAPGAITFKSVYIPFGLITGNHRGATTNLGIAPHVIHWPGRAFTDDFVAAGGYPRLNDFDVMEAQGTTQVQMSYNTSQSNYGAVISNLNGNAHVVLAGFGFSSVADDETNGVSDRAMYLRDAIVWMGNALPQVTDAGPLHRNELLQNYPNPFNPQTTIAFSIKARGRVRLAVYDVAGRLVRSLLDEEMAAGPHQARWDGRDHTGQPVASGVYFYRLVATDFSSTRKMVVLK